MEQKEFHNLFEKKDTKGHMEFLEFLGLSDDDIDKVLEYIKK